jgi:hypothetical protein
VKTGNPKNQILLIIIIFIILLITLNFFNKNINESFNLASEILQLIFSIITLVIAINIYDKFGINKNITEKRTELLLKLLIELKGLNFRVIIKSEKSISLRFFVSSKDITKNLDGLSKDQLDTKIIFKINDQNQISEKLKYYNDNPVLPKKIRENLNFLKPSPGDILDFNELDNVSALNFYINDSKTEKTDWIYNENLYNLNEFVIKFRDLFTEIEKWINEHSNLKDDLNI